MLSRFILESPCWEWLSHVIPQKKILRFTNAPRIDQMQWPERMESLVGLQQDMQLEYKTAAAELLHLREQSNELAQAHRKLEAEEADASAKDGNEKGSVLFAKKREVAL